MACEVVSSSIATGTDVRGLRTIYAGYFGHRLLNVNCVDGKHVTIYDIRWTYEEPV